MSNILSIFKSEFVKMFKDKGTLLIMVGGVFMYGLFYMIPFHNHTLHNIPIAVVDFDNSALSRELIRDFDSNESLEVTSRPVSIDEAQEEYFRNKIRAYVVIPKDFERDIFRGGNSYISSYEDSAFLIIYKQVATGVMTSALSMGAKIEIGSFMKKGLSKEQAMNIKLPFEFVQNPLYNPIGSYQNYIYPLILILILQQTLIIGSGMLGATDKERLNGYKKWTENGIVELKEDSFCKFSKNPMEIVFGKSLAYFSLYFFYALMYFLLMPAIVVYDMTYNILPLILLLIPFLFSVTFFGQAMIYFYTERENSLLVFVVTSVPMIFLPGFVWPKECIPMWLRIFSEFIPATAAMDGITKVNQMGASLFQVQNDLWILLGLCVLYFYLACKVVSKIK